MMEKDFFNMTHDVRITACYQHAVMTWVTGGDRLRNKSLCERFGLKETQASHATHVIGATRDKGLIKYAEPERPRAGHIPFWA